MSTSFKTAKGTELPLIKLKGKDYLEVKYRLVWFREEKPDWSIESELVHFSDKIAVSRATIKDPAGRIVAMGHKMETPQGFSDYIEKAETGSIGRALALIGYGTQFAPDLDEGDRIVDAPAQRPKAPANPFKSQVNPQGPRPPQAPPPPPRYPGEISHDVGHWKMPTGKFKDRRLMEINPKELKSYVDWIIQSNLEKNKQPTGPYKEIVDHATAFLSTLEVDSITDYLNTDEPIPN